MTGPIDEAGLRRALAEALAPIQAELAAMRAAQAAPQAPMVAPEEFAAMLGVHPRTLHRMELAGDVPPAIRVGAKTVRWHRAVVEEFIRTGRVDSQPDRLHIRRKRRSV